MYDFEYIKDECDKNIVFLIEKLGVEYRKENGWVCIRCPFHKSEKFNLKYKNKMFFCFSECKRAYSVIDVVGKILDMDMHEAIEWICKTLLLDPDCNTEKIRTDRKKFEGKRIMEEFKKLKGLKDTEIQALSSNELDYVHPYYGDFLEQLQVSKETAELFHICYSDGGSLNGRIIFPIFSPEGRLISLSGRMLDYDLLKTQKYKVLSGTKSHDTLYGINLTKDYIRETGTAIVVEGFKSVLFLWENGIRNCCAVVGAACSKQQARILLKYAKKVIVCGDNDSAGREMEQSVYNRLYRYMEVERLNIGEFTDKEKASVDDLDFEEFIEFEEKLREVM